MAKVRNWPQPGNNQAIPTTTAAPTTSAGGTQSPLEALTQRLQQGPQSTMGERLGITDEGLGISSILGSLAKAVDPSGWGGNLGGAYSQMMQGESAARNSRDIAYEQQMQNLTMMQLLQGLISGNNGGGLSQ